MRLRTVIGLFTVCASAFGGTITLNSTAANTINDTDSPTIRILKHPAWGEPVGGSEWVSTRESGDNAQAGFFEFENGTTITFSQRFNLPGPATGGSIWVMADDTTAVSLNGKLLFPASTTSGPACAANAIGCLESTTGVVSYSLMQPNLAVGMNVLSFAVQQQEKVAFGLTYSGYVNHLDQGDHAPEPASVLLSTTGLAIGALVMRQRRRRSF